MRRFPGKLQSKLNSRKGDGIFRELPTYVENVDFSSNDYLGFSLSKTIFENADLVLQKKGIHKNGATGSRLLSGNHQLYRETESMLAKFHNAEAALIFNSGYDANVGFFSSVPQRGDVVFYDELIHASIRDGVQMSHAKSYKFAHNDIEDLKVKLLSLRACLVGRQAESRSQQEVYVVTESVFSMDGDTPDLKAFVNLCQEYNCHLVVDEAHATGVFGDQGVGLIQDLQLEDQVFARINTFGKAMGCHGAVILGSETLKDYLVNFARSFIYTTGLPPHSLATIQGAYQQLENTREIEKLQKNIQFFNQQIETTTLKPLFIPSNSAIQCCVISGKERVKNIALEIQKRGFDVKPILSPTVPEGKERLRFCLHSYNTKQEIVRVLELLTTFVSN